MPYEGGNLELTITIDYVEFLDLFFEEHGWKEASETRRKSS